MANNIVIKGAREHNLQNINLKLPRDKFIVITGISGSGKSSLAFDTIYAEGQRRYVESLSAYARQFLGQMKKPDVDYIEGLSPAISIDQKATKMNPRSTVGTITEIYDYLRLLFARIGKPHCYICGKEISQQTSTQIVERILQEEDGARIYILAPIIKDRKGEHKKVLEKLKRDGYARVRVDGEIHSLEEDFDLEKNRKHTIEVVVDRLITRSDTNFRKRLADSIETSLELGEGTLTILYPDRADEKVFSEHFACTDCGISFEEISPRMFSFNSPHGACPECNGLGSKLEIDPNLVVPKPELSLNQGAIIPWSKSFKKENYYYQMLKAVAKHYNFSMDTPFKDLDPEYQKIILYGSHDRIQFVFKRKNRKYRVNRRFEGVIPRLERIYLETKSNYMRRYIGEFMSNRPCPACGGSRLRPESLAVTINGKSIHEITEMSIKEALKFFKKLKLTPREEYIAKDVLREIKERLKFLIDVGLEYLTLNRSSGTLAGGEAQRIRLATQIGSRLVGVLYILDEPTIGLHQRDNIRLINTLKKLRDLGNTLIVVEHDPETILSADYIVDIGLGAGEHGGRIVATGTPEEIMENRESLTGAYLSGRKTIPTPSKRRKSDGRHITIIGAGEHNLKEIDVKIPLGVFTCVTGVSGSGKSTLVNDILYKGLYERLNNKHMNPGKHKDIKGVHYLDKVVIIDQSPIGRTPRSNPATYTGVFTYIRKLFAQTAEAKKRGYKPGRFSFNVKGGRCEACNGDGIIKIEMHFLADVYIPCEVCKGKRYNEETLQIRYKGKNIAEILDMTVEEALDFFHNIPSVKNKLQTLYDVGLGYIKLGQPATTLSGGEAQRVKLAKELSRKSTGKTLYILDEPTTGLHFDDIKKLLDVLNRLVDAGNTVVVIEHNLDVIKMADYIIDLGPEGGEEGGRIVAEGTPEKVAESGTYTGKFLKKVIESTKPPFETTILEADKVKE
ncbi:MAG: excinuclease ABC subunit UvrA [Methanobacteriales archaeon]|nr:excinuclease ABC subunit UvrA [Methanobacteriaceae archaeon]